MELHERLRLERPLVVFDCESTGNRANRDRIVEIAIVKFYTDGRRRPWTQRFNPTIPISPAATAVHGITDDMVRDAPLFREFAPRIARGLEGCDLAGYNVRDFDVPLLLAEFERAKTAFSLEGRRIIDAQAIFFKREPRNLSAALRFFCNRELEGAHCANADTRATVDVLLGQLDRYGDLPASVEQLHDYCRNPTRIDLAGKFVWVDGVACLGFSEYEGRTLESMTKDPASEGFLRWMLKKDFSADTKAIVREALSGRFPQVGVVPPNGNGTSGEE